MNKHKVGYKRYKDIQERYDSYINKSKLSKKSKEILKEWIEERRGNKYRDVNNIGLLGTVINVSESIGMNLSKVDNKKKIKDFFSNNSFKPSQELWYKKSLKRFYKWLSSFKDNPQYLININWINTKELSRKCHEQSTKKREDNLLSPEEVRKMISKVPLLRDKLAISLLSDTGIRAESIGVSRNKRSINVGQLDFHKGYAIIKDIEEKFDKKRNVIVTEALSYLIKYWNELPEDYRDKSDNPLFIAYSTNRYGKRWGYSGLKDMLHKVSREVLGRIINPHDFRHLKGTRLHLDEHLSDDAKCKLMGWSSRRMLDRYNHTKFDDAKNEYLEKKGIIKIDKNKKVKVEPSILKPKECLVCHHINSTTDVICEKCGNSLDYEQMIKDFSRRQKEGIDNKTLLIIKKLTELNPKLMEELVKGIQELKKLS